MKIRYAKFEDKKELMGLLIQAQELHSKNRPDIFKKIFKEEVENEVIELLENQEKEVIVAVDDKERTCGVVIFKIKVINDHINLRNAKILYIEKIVVDEKCQRQGIGTLLIQEVKKRANSLNCSRIELNCWNFNEKAIDFYQTQGMKIQRLNMEIKLEGE